MAESNQHPQVRTAFVTGATGLLGNNLVRLLASRGVYVKALVRSRQKAQKQFADLPIEIVSGDMTEPAGFAAHLQGVDILFHTAAFFRDNFKGGRHWKELHDTNVRGTTELLEHACAAGIRRVVHTSSVAVLRGAPGQITYEAMRRSAGDESGAELRMLVRFSHDELPVSEFFQDPRGLREVLRGRAGRSNTSL